MGKENRGIRGAGKRLWTKGRNYLLNKKEKLTLFWYSRYYGDKIILLESQQVLSGNSGALYHYLRSKKEYRKYVFVCLLRRFDRTSFHNKRRVLAFSIDDKSPQKRWLVSHALIAFFDDVPIRSRLPGAPTVYLTHGSPALKNVKGIINVPDYVDYAICTSSCTIPLMSEQFSFPKEKFFVAGLPRNDVLFQEKKDISSLVDPDEYHTVVLWTPTFRKVSFNSRNDSGKEQPLDMPLLETRLDVEALEQFLSDHGMALWIKPHPYQDVSQLKQITGFKHIHILFADQLAKKGIDVNDLFLHTDALISDYSSIAFDYLLIDRPIAYVTDDAEAYKLGFVPDFEALTPGRKLKNMEDLFSFLGEISRGEDGFSAERRRVRDYVHTCKNGGYCESIEKLFLQTIIERRS